VTATSITDPYVTLVFDFTGADGYSESRTLRQVESGEPAQLNLNFLPVNSSITMIVTATADNSTMTTSPFKRLTGLRVVEMGISKVSADEYMPAINTGESYRLSLNFEPTGPKNVANFTEQLHVYIDNVENYDLSR
jgi:N-dimethylarginine dimethylaminohydrolase